MGPRLVKRTKPDLATDLRSAPGFERSTGRPNSPPPGLLGLKIRRLSLIRTESRAKTISMAPMSYLQKFASVVAWVTLRLVTSVASGSGSGLAVIFSTGETSLPIPNQSERLTNLGFETILRKVIVASVQQISPVTSSYCLEIDVSC